MSLEVKNLTKIYADQLAVNDVSFSVNEGDILGFLGPNGAGKSTTMKIATGYIPATSGTVTLEGWDLGQNSLEARKLVGYLPEHNPLYLDMYVHEYLTFVGNVRRLKAQDIKSNLAKVIEQCGLTKEQNKKIGALSKGYRQRVGLAQALLHDPKVLILDEPTTGLDPNQIVEIRQLIKEVSKNKTVIFSTHIMQEVQAICNKVVIINKGKLVANKTLLELKSESATSSILKVDFLEPIDIDQIRSIPGIIDIQSHSANGYLITASQSVDIRNTIINLSAKNNWQLSSMQLQESSLEEIFKKLTTNTLPQ
jgi:ABC-2 type transport system ATP-binding protein